MDKKRDESQFSEEETARRRDEVIRRMANTPPKPRATSQNPPAKTQRTLTAPGQSCREPDARKG